MFVKIEKKGNTYRITSPLVQGEAVTKSRFQMAEIAISLSQDIKSWEEAKKACKALKLNS